MAGKWFRVDVEGEELYHALHTVKKAVECNGNDAELATDSNNEQFIAVFVRDSQNPEQELEKLLHGIYCIFSKLKEKDLSVSEWQRLKHPKE